MRLSQMRSACQWMPAMTFHDISGWRATERRISAADQGRRSRTINAVSIALAPRRHSMRTASRSPGSVSDQEYSRSMGMKGET